MATIRADFALTAADWSAAHRLQERASQDPGLKKLLIHLVRLALVTVFLCSVLYSIQKPPRAAVARPEPTNAMPAISLLVLTFGLTFVVARFIGPLRAFKASGLARRPLCYTLTDNAFQWSDSAGGGTIQMSYFIRWQEGPTLFVLTPASNGRAIFPKRALADGQEGELRTLLGALIGPEGETRKLPSDQASLCSSNGHEPITVETSLTRHDVEEFTRLHAKSSASISEWLTLSLLSLVSGLGIAGCLSNKGLAELTFAPIHLGISAALLGFLVLSVLRRSTQNLTNSGLEDTVVRYTIRDGIFSFSSPYFEQTRKLSALHKWTESSNLLVIFENANGMYLMPKRSLSEEQVDLLRRTLTDQIGPVGKPRA